ncbi:MAG: ribosome small subunit-dependent GTPase A [Coriobacteriia bacterium]|nr:ribosome small subunit-dependent GTPase A [Coriobacteriia bacterium]
MQEAYLSDTAGAYYPSFEKLGGFALENIFEDILIATRKESGLTLEKPETLELACVIKLDRGYPLVMTRQGPIRAEHAIALVKQTESRAVIGDWLLLRRPDAHDKAIIEAIVPRRSEFSRWDKSSTANEQVLAANIDTVFVMVTLNKKPLTYASLERMVKSVVIAKEARCEVAIVLTKADRKKHEEDLAEDIQTIKRVVPDLELIVTSSYTAQGLQELKASLDEKEIAVVLGESGAGKSSLINALLERDELQVGTVRERDDKGRHTTVAREMISIPHAGILIDAPGLRSIPLVQHEDGLKMTFPEISEAALRCKFSDCSHQNEPGCSVQELVSLGTIDPLRLELYSRIQDEMIKSKMLLDPSV